MEKNKVLILDHIHQEAEIRHLTNEEWEKIDVQLIAIDSVEIYPIEVNESINDDGQSSSILNVFENIVICDEITKKIVFNGSALNVPYWLLKKVTTQQPVMTEKGLYFWVVLD